MSEGIDEWIESLLAELKAFSVSRAGAISRFDQLDQQGDPYAETLRRAAARLSLLVKRM
jgi:hypothetical protein